MGVNPWEQVIPEIKTLKEVLVLSPWSFSPHRLSKTRLKALNNIAQGNALGKTT